MSEFAKSRNVVRDALVDVQDARLRQQANEAEIKQLLGPELYEDWQDLRQQTGLAAKAGPAANDD
jgi:hypothetical protein